MRTLLIIWLTAALLPALAFAAEDPLLKMMDQVMGQMRYMSIDRAARACARADRSSARNCNELEAEALGGNARAQFRLGVLYLQGKALQRDDRLGRDMIRLAAAQGHNPAVKWMHTFQLVPKPPGQGAFPRTEPKLITGGFGLVLGEPFDTAITVSVGVSNQGIPFYAVTPPIRAAPFELVTISVTPATKRIWRINGYNNYVTDADCRNQMGTLRAELSSKYGKPVLVEDMLVFGTRPRIIALSCGFADPAEPVTFLQLSYIDTALSKFNKAESAAPLMPFARLQKELRGVRTGL